MRLLIADGDGATRDLLEAALRMAWPASTLVLVADGRAAVRAMQDEVPDLAILALDLPVLDGYAALREIRRLSDVPVVAIAPAGAGSVSAEAAELRALDLGADDVVFRPLRPLAIVARIRAIERRAGLVQDGHAPPDFVAGDLTVEFSTHSVSVGGRPVKLTPLEYRVLYHLVRNAGRVVPHPALADRVWGMDGFGGPNELKVFVSRLRAKIEQPGAPHLIETVRGLGYRFVRP